VLLGVIICHPEGGITVTTSTVIVGVAAAIKDV
jgi:hypothetical protein